MSRTLKLPEVGQKLRCAGTLVEIKDVTPPPPPRVVEYVFEDIEWHIELWANGHFIDRRGTMLDDDDQPKQVVAEAMQVAAVFGRGVEVRVLKETRRYTARPTDTPDLYNPDFAEFTDVRPLRGATESAPEVVWSSHEKKGGAA